mgnify:CR=1 FL=1
MVPRPPSSTLFPSTALFRSAQPVGPAVAMKADEENGPALEIRQTLRVNEPDTVKIDPPDEPVQDSMPKLDDARHDEEIAPSMHPPTL